MCIIPKPETLVESGLSLLKVSSITPRHLVIFVKLIHVINFIDCLFQGVMVGVPYIGTINLWVQFILK